MSKLIDLSGKTFGKWLVLSKGISKDNKTYWCCECSCGTIRDVYSYSLTSGNSTNCGCKKYADLSEKFSENLTNIRFGKLVAIKKEEKNHNSPVSSTYWKCICDCGNETVVRSGDLKRGKSQSCGCVKSWGELSITKILLRKKILFKQQYYFKELKGDERYLRFDFAIFGINNTLQCLIEYQGKQHFETTSGWGTEEKLIKTIEYDNLKVNYCSKNNIMLFFITYLDDIEEKINELVDQLATGKIAPESIT